MTQYKAKNIFQIPQTLGPLEGKNYSNYDGTHMPLIAMTKIILNVRVSMQFTSPDEQLILKPYFISIRMTFKCPESNFLTLFDHFENKVKVQVGVSKQ